MAVIPVIVDSAMKYNHRGYPTDDCGTCFRSKIFHLRPLSQVRVWLHYAGEKVENRLTSSL
jgi:hypothetical protein